MCNCHIDEDFLHRFFYVTVMSFQLLLLPKRQFCRFISVTIYDAVEELVKCLKSNPTTLGFEHGDPSITGRGCCLGFRIFNFMTHCFPQQYLVLPHLLVKLVSEYFPVDFLRAVTHTFR